MQPETYQPAGPEPPVNIPLASMQPGERIICEIKRHPIGILMVYAAESIVLIAVAVIVLVLLPAVLGGGDPGPVRDIGGVVFFIFAIVSLGFVFVANVVYWGNRWVVTSDSITQVNQTGLFHKQSSQLSFEHLEDITAEQNGMLATALRFGVLRAETAGESSKFVFRYCPNPNYYAQKILAAREVFERTKGSAREGVSPAPTMPSAPPPPPPPPVPVDQTSVGSQPPVYPTQPPSAVPDSENDSTGWL